MAQTFDALMVQGGDTGNALRTTRQLVLERLLCLDCDAQATLQQITQAMTDLAEFTLDRACRQAQRTLDQTHGMPTTADGNAPSSGSWAWANLAHVNSMSPATLT